MKRISTETVLPNSLLGMKKKVYIFISLSVFILFSAGLFSSCGFVGMGGGNVFGEDSTASGDPGDGDTPRLSSRFEEDPELEDKDCEGNDRCEEACRDIYEELDSYEDCYELTIGKVALIQEVFYALVGADPEELESIKEEDLEDYLDIGLDGWSVKVIKKLKAKSDNIRKERFSNTLEWIVDQENLVVSVLEGQDKKNKVLEEVFLGHCHIGADGGCDDGSVSTDGVSRTAGELFYKGVKVAYIEDEEGRYALFEALKAGKEIFFERAAGNRRFDAFGAGNKLLGKVCTHRKDKSIEQCIRAFYCWLDENTGINYQDRIFSHDSFIEIIGKEIDLDCEISDFCGDISDPSCE